MVRRAGISPACAHILSLQRPPDKHFHFTFSIYPHNSVIPRHSSSSLFTWQRNHHCHRFSADPKSSCHRRLPVNVKTLCHFSQYRSKALRHSFSYFGHRLKSCFCFFDLANGQPIHPRRLNPSLYNLQYGIF